jgi:hypothetical protein
MMENQRSVPRDILFPGAASKCPLFQKTPGFFADMKIGLHPFATKKHQPRRIRTYNLPGCL